MEQQVEGDTETETVPVTVFIHASVTVTVYVVVELGFTTNGSEVQCYQFHLTSHRYMADHRHWHSRSALLSCRTNGSGRNSWATARGATVTVVVAVVVHPVGGNSHCVHSCARILVATGFLQCRIGQVSSRCPAVTANITVKH